VLIERPLATSRNHRREGGLGCAQPRNFPRKTPGFYRSPPRDGREDRTPGTGGTARRAPPPVRATVPFEAGSFERHGIPPYPDTRPQFDSPRGRCYLRRPPIWGLVPPLRTPISEVSREEDVPTASQEPQAHPRISQAHEDRRRARGDPAPSPERSQAADGHHLEEVAPRKAGPTRASRVPLSARAPASQAT